MNHIKWFFFISAATFCNKAFAERDHPIHFVGADNSFPRPLIPSYFSKNEKSPMETIIDVSNNLAYRILVTHSFLNRNNFAFSPSELMGVLAALYEAADGDSSRQIAYTLALPLNSDNLRIGYRDIFMKLKTYLYKTDPPLQSLRFNRDNITIHNAYKDILNFYGFDLAADMIISRIVCNSENQSSSTEKTKEASNTTKTTPTTTSIAATTTTTTTMTATPSTTAELVTSTLRTSETTTDALTTSNESEMSSTQNIEDGSGFPEDAEIVKDNNQELLLADNMPLLRLLKSDNNIGSSKASGKPMATLSPPPVSYLPSIARSAKSFHHRSHGKNERNKRFIQGSDFYEYVALIQPETQEYHSLGPVPTVYFNDHLQLPPNFVISDNTKWTLTKEPINDYFLLPDNQAIRINFKTFNSMALFRYFNHLGMAVLELEMNAPETSLMILLPDTAVEPMHATESLLQTESLRNIRSQLRATWVQARIPDFKLYGTMFLTNDLQNLRVCDIFEPHRADFSSMTNEKGIYVRHIEQAINLSISSLSATINKLNHHHGLPVEPIHFYANRQFFFFVIDKGLGVATMAGRILNPLNVRIQ